MTPSPPDAYDKLEFVSKIRRMILLKAPPEWREYTSGFIAQMVNLGLTFPIHKTMFRQMVHDFGVRDALRQLRTEGGIKLYRGVALPLLYKSFSNGIMFGTYAQYSREIRDLNAGFPAPFIQSLAAFLAGCTEAVLTPFERVQVLLQDSKNHSSYRNTTDALRKLANQHGFREYYRGFSGVLMRNGPSNVIFFYSREKVKDLLPPEWEDRSSTKYAADFLCGAFTGALISTIMYPINVTRTHMQLVVGGSFVRFSTVLKELLKKRGLSGMFRGVHLNYSRSFLAWGVINTTYEFVHRRLKDIGD